jgi:hypothetical protein
VNIQDLVLSILSEDPTLSNEEVADLVQKRVPGSTTSAASVSSVKSKAKRSGLLSATAAAPYERLPAVSAEELPPETEEERYDRIARRFRTLHRMAEKVADGDLPALIVSGPPGLGKSFTVEQVLQERFGDPVSTLDPEFDEAEPGYDIISGTMTAPGLIIALWNMRHGGVVVIDDCDDVFRDETCLNILKAVLDSSSRRTVSYRKRAHWMEEMGIPTSFDFEGSVVFCTNIDFEAAVRKGSPMAPHFEALIDRSLYLSLTMRTADDFITRIRQVAMDEHLLENKGLTPKQAQEVFDFIVENRERFYGLSLRLVGQIAICFKADPETWRDDVICTKCRTY